MAFKAELRFGGLCANVPIKSLNEEKHETLWVVMPDARDPAKPSICKHFPGIFLDAARLEASDGAVAASSGVSSGKFFWGIQRKEITLRPIGLDGVEIPRGLKIPKDDHDTNFRRVPDLGQIFPDAATMHSGFKEDKKSLGLVVSRVILQHGTLRARPISGHAPIYFPDGKAFDIQENPIPFAHDTVLELGELKSLEIHARDLDSETEDVKTLVVAEGTGRCVIGCGNLCADLWLLELAKIVPYPGELGTDVDDLDFEAFYDLSEPPPKGKRPVPRSRGGGGPTGAKCHQAIFNPFIEKQPEEDELDVV